jgi:16S rRNA (cytosine967-C5)-methyltransferase
LHIEENHFFTQHYPTMSESPFRQTHLFKLLQFYDHQTLPLDVWMNQYFRAHSALGSKDRAWIAETVYALMRWRALLDYLSSQPPSWQKRFEIFKQIDLEEIQRDETVPPHVRVSFPPNLFQWIVQSHGFQRAIDVCLASNHPAPTTVRVNLLKTTREALLQQWQDQYAVSPCPVSSAGILFHKRINFFELPEFRAGLFEVQDEGSQLVADLVQAHPGDLVLDYCAGSGGKTLAFAPRLANQGQIFLHDVRMHALEESRKRLRRAGIQNAQLIPPDSPKLKKLKKRMDWVLVDAPCSGTGTLRRNPDMKWRFTDEMVQRLVGQQRLIFEKALSYVKPGGHIVYATCSILRNENSDQLNHFLKTYALQLVQEPFSSLPSQGGMDGFFAGVLILSN